MLCVINDFEDGYCIFQALVESQSTERRIVSVESETIVKIKQGIYPFVFEAIAQRIFTLLAFNIICTLS